MTARFNHTIIASHDPATMAQFYVDLLDTEPVDSWGPFTNVQIEGGVMLQFATPPIDFPPQHYAFLLDDAHFDRSLTLIQDRGLAHWADPQRQMPGQINHGHDGRGVYLLDPSGHYLELITSPYL